MNKPGEKKNGQRIKKKTVTEFDNPPSDPSGLPSSDFTETEDTRDYSGYGAALDEYIAASGGNKEFTAKLYKYDDQIKQKQYLVCTSHNGMLSEEDIGLQYGSGSYRYLVIFPNNKPAPKAFLINLHKSYDERRARLGMSSGQPGPVRSPLVDSLDILEKLASIMKLMQPPAPPPQSFDPRAMLAPYQAVNDVMMSQLKSNIGLHRDIFNQYGKGKGELEDMQTVEEVDEKPNIVEQLLPYLEKYIPLILGGGKQGDLLVKTAKGLPLFKAIMQDREQLKALFQELGARLSKEEMDALLKKFNIKKSDIGGGK